MKKIIAAVAAIILISCNSNNAGSKTLNNGPDTTFCLIVYKSALDTNVNYGVFPRVVADSLMWVTTDTVTQKKMWVKDTFYLITYLIPIDSATSKLRNLKMYDSTGKRILYPTNPIATNKRFVRSGWENLDSAVSQLKRLK